MGARVHTPAHRRIIPERRKRAIKASFAAVILAVATYLSQANAGAATPFSTAQPGTFAGAAFDACTAPPSESMKAWKANSPYQGIGIYIGGVSRGCAQSNLTAAWVQEQVTAGWKLLPLYVGPQASCSGKKNLIDNGNADAQGRAAAGDAVTQAVSLGLAPQTVIIYDLEAYPTTDADCRAGVFAFLNGWTVRLHEFGYFSGFYSSVSSGVADQVANYSAPGYTPPDYLDFARWDQVVTTDDSGIPGTMWTPQRRMKQYRGGHTETYGDVTINIDNNTVDFAPLPAAKMADFTGNGWSDLVARNPGNGYLYAYPGTGTVLAMNQRVTIGAGGWNAMSAVIRVGDLNRDGREDVVCRDGRSDLWFYPGTTTGFGARKKIGSNWNVMREITPVGDLNRDGYPDLVALQGGTLYFYPGKSGSALGSRVYLGVGWTSRAELAGAGDFNRDGYPDLVARDNGNGSLWVYPGVGGGKFGSRWSLGGGWNNYRDIVGIGDFDRDGFTDLMAIRKSDNGALLFRGTGRGLQAGKFMAYFGTFGPLA